MKEKGRDRRLRTGCLICKLRHVKCGEERPNCKNCIEANRQCMGYPLLSVVEAASSSSATTAQTQLESKAERQVSKASSSKNPSHRPQWSQKEIRSFSFSLHKTIPNLTTYFESEFWNKQIPRLAHHEPAVRHALSALAAFHEKSHRHDALVEAKGKLDGNDFVPESIDKFFLQQYTKAISELRQKMSSNDHQAVVSTLVCCFIFMCIEGLHGRHLAMVNHIVNGLKVYHEWIRCMDPNQHFGPASLEASVFVTFRRIDYHAATFIDNHVPEPHTLTVIQLPPPIDDFNPTFISIEQARAHVDSLLGRTFMFLRAYDGTKFGDIEFEKIPQDIRDKHRVVGIWLHSCIVALDQFIRNNNLSESTMGSRSMTLLKLRLKTLSIFHRRWPHERAANEECELEFHSIVSLAKSLVMGSIKGLLTPDDSDQDMSHPSDSSEGASSSHSSSTTSSSGPHDPPIFTLETGIVPILFYLSVTTLTPSLSREAISLLRTANLREGLWSSNRAADMAETRLAITNGAANPMTGSEMSELTKKLWVELEIEEKAESWGIS